MGLVDFLVHAETRIAAPAHDVWPFILDTNAWFTQQMRPAGEGRFDVFDPAAPAQVLFHMENVELVPQQRRTVRLDAVDGACLGYATWVLREGDDGTQVGYHVYCRVPAPPETDGAELAAEAQRRSAGAFARLKGLVEGG